MMSRQSARTTLAFIIRGYRCDVGNREECEKILKVSTDVLTKIEHGTGGSKRQIELLLDTLLMHVAIDKITLARIRTLIAMIFSAVPSSTLIGGN